MSVITGVASTIAVVAIVIGLCASLGRAKLESEIIRLREGEEK